MKTYVTRTELLAIINRGIAGAPECADCEVAGPLYHLRSPEPDGSNWSDQLIIRGHGCDPRPCAPAAVRAALDARQSYALRNDGGWLDDLVFEDAGHHFFAVAENRETDDQPYWYVSIDSASECRAFAATVDDRDPEDMRDRILAWWRAGARAPKPQDLPNDRPTVSSGAMWSIEMPSRFIYRSFQIDTNRINSRGGLEHMNRLEHWHVDGVIHLDMSEVAHAEARAGGDARRTDKALGYIYSMTLAGTTAEQGQLRSIEATLFPSGTKTSNERNDVEIVFNALKYHRILVTNDGGSASQPGGILGKCADLEALGVIIMRDSEAVTYIVQEIARRDHMARTIAAHTGQTLPDWVGKD